MNIAMIETPVLITSIENHLEIKNDILNGIDAMGTHNLIENKDKISNTDWHLPPSVNRSYGQFFEPVFNKTLNNINEFFGYKKYEQKLSLKNYWFQQYKKDDTHNWHIHNESLFSNVYYVELPNESAKTTFLIGNKEIEIDVKEGDVLTFPSCFLHCSKPNGHGRKTVISFNI